MKTITLQPNVWVEISSESCKYQNISNNGIYTFEGTEAPEGLDDIFIAKPLDMYLFTSSSNNKLYAYSPYSEARITVG